MKILQVVMGLDPRIGGPVSSLTTAVEAERLGGHDVTVLCCAGDADDSGGNVRWQGAVRRIEDSGARVVPLRRTRRPARAAAKFGLAPGGPIWLVRHAADYDVVHVRSVWGGLSLAALFLSRLRRVPVVLTPHESLTNYDSRTSAGRFFRLAKMLLRPFVVRAPMAIVLTSTRERVDSGLNGFERAVVIPHAVAVPSFQFKRVAPRDGAPTRIGFLGRLHPKKNVHLLIDALALDESLLLTVAGRGEEEFVAGLRQRAASIGVAGRVTWLDFIAPEARPAFFSSIDVLLLPSEYENFGMAAAEAMAHGVPVIATGTTGIAEVISRFGGGLLVEPNAADVVATVQALRVNNPEQAEVSAVARDHLSHSAYEKQVTHMYRTVTSTRRT